MIYLVLKIKAIEDVFDKGGQTTVGSKFLWKKADENKKLEYSEKLSSKLFNLKIPSTISGCQDVHCADPDHIKEIDKYAFELLESVSDSGNDLIPKSEAKKNVKKNTKKKVEVGWKEFVEPYQDKANFWNSVWRSAGSPINTELYKVAKQSIRLTQTVSNPNLNLPK